MKRYSLIYAVAVALTSLCSPGFADGRCPGSLLIYPVHDSPRLTWPVSIHGTGYVFGGVALSGWQIEDPNLVIAIDLTSSYLSSVDGTLSVPPGPCSGTLLWTFSGGDTTTPLPGIPTRVPAATTVAGFGSGESGVGNGGSASRVASVPRTASRHAFDIYNDNEFALSGFGAFHCWFEEVPGGPTPSASATNPARGGPLPGNPSDGRTGPEASSLT